MLRSTANILDSSRRKHFLSLSPLINLSNSSCTESEIDDNRSKITACQVFVISLSSYICFWFCGNFLKDQRVVGFYARLWLLKIKKIFGRPFRITDWHVSLPFFTTNWRCFLLQKVFFKNIFSLKKASYFLFEVLFLYLIALKKLLKIRNLTFLLFQLISRVSDVFVLAISYFPQF